MAKSVVIKSKLKCTYHRPDFVLAENAGIRVDIWSTALKMHPLQSSHLKCSSGRSTETALEICSARQSKGVAICVCLGIDGTFDNTSYKAVLERLSTNGT